MKINTGNVFASGSPDSSTLWNIISSNITPNNSNSNNSNNNLLSANSQKYISTSDIADYPTIGGQGAWNSNYKNAWNGFFLTKDSAIVSNTNNSNNNTNTNTNNFLKIQLDDNGTGTVTIPQSNNNNINDNTNNNSLSPIIWNVKAPNSSTLLSTTPASDGSIVVVTMSNNSNNNLPQVTAIVTKLDGSRVNYSSKISPFNYAGALPKVVRSSNNTNNSSEETTYDILGDNVFSAYGLTERIQS
jgi:hypothetical protein